MTDGSGQQGKQPPGEGDSWGPRPDGSQHGPEVEQAPWQPGPGFEQTPPRPGRGFEQDPPQPGAWNAPGTPPQQSGWPQQTGASPQHPGWPQQPEGSPQHPGWPQQHPGWTQQPGPQRGGWPQQQDPRQGSQPPQQGDWPRQPHQGDWAAQQAGWPQQDPRGQQPVACAYHPDRAAGVRCQRCGNPICGACMVEAPVGHQCRRCLTEGLAATRQRELPFGGTRSANPALTSIVLIAINVALWLGTLVTGGGNSRLTSLLALTPSGLCERGSDLFVGATPQSCTALGGTFLPGVVDGAWWQVITSAFMHISPIHLGFNMFVLWMLGPQLERVLGRARFLALYLVSALTGSAAVLWLSEPTTTTLGASGAIFGLLGALLVLAIRSGGDVRSILMWLGINVVISVVGAASISWQGHLGGFIGGVLVALALVHLRRGGSRTQWLAVAGLAVLSLALMVGRAVLLT